jgi:hypothetical protein
MVATYQGPPTEGLDIFGLKAAIIKGELDDRQTAIIPRVGEDVRRPFLKRGRRRQSSDRLFWTMLTVGLILCFLVIIYFSTVGVYSWLVAHGA